MKNIKYACLVLAAALFTASCGAIAPSAKPYASTKDGFTVTFPGGSKDVVAQKRQYGNDGDMVYMTVNNNGAYRVKVIYWKQYDESGTLDGDLTGSGASPGTDRPLDPETKQTTVAGKPALDETGWSWSENPGADGAPVKMQTRVVGFRADKDKLFLIEMKTLEKEKLTSKEANDFFASFKLGADAAAK
jgi:hypothetical protein